MTRRVSSSSSLFTKAFHTRRTRNNTNLWCCFVFGVFLSPTTCTEHEMTPLLVFFSCSAPFLRPTTHETTPTLVSSCHFLALRARNHTNEGVISCSASFLSTTTHAWHRAWNNTLVGVVLCSASFLCPITDAKYEMIPLSMSFCVWHLFHSPTTHQAQSNTLVGVVSCSDLFLSPRTNFEGVY